MEHIERIKHHFNESIHTKITTADLSIDKVAQIGEKMVQCLLNSNKIICCGNGSSAALAQLFAANMLNRFDTERPSLPALALTTNPSMLSSTADDNIYHQVFSKQIKALGQAGDILFAITNHGHTKNIADCIDVAHQRGIHVVILSGEDSATFLPLLNENDVCIQVPSHINARIQETHLLIIHCLCDMIDQQLFKTEE